MIGSVVAVGVVCLILLFLHSLLDSDKHYIFQLLLIVFVLVSTFLVIPKMVIDEQTVCESVVANTTLSANTTTYEYTDRCFVRPETTGQTFYNISTTMFYLFLGYLIVFLAFWSFFRLRDSVSGGKRG